MSGRYDHLSAKSRGYAEGVVAGFAEARDAVERLTGGLLTLQMPQKVHEWDGVVRELQGRRERLSPKAAVEMNTITLRPRRWRVRRFWKIFTGLAPLHLGLVSRLTISWQSSKRVNPDSRPQ